MVGLRAARCDRQRRQNRNRHAKMMAGGDPKQEKSPSIFELRWCRQQKSAGSGGFSGDEVRED